MSKFLSHFPQRNGHDFPLHFSHELLMSFINRKYLRNMYMYMYMYVNNVYVYNVNNVCTQTINKTNKKSDKTQTAVKNFMVCCHTPIFTLFI